MKFQLVLLVCSGSWTSSSIAPCGSETTATAGNQSKGALWLCLESPVDERICRSKGLPCSGMPGVLIRGTCVILYFLECCFVVPLCAYHALTLVYSWVLCTWKASKTLRSILMNKYLIYCIIFIKDFNPFHQFWLFSMVVNNNDFH